MLAKQSKFHHQAKSATKNGFQVALGCVYTGPAEYLVGQIFGRLGLAFTWGRLNDLKLDFWLQVFDTLRKS